MTPQLLIVKIQSILGGSSDATEQQKRAYAAEYCRRCSEAREHLESVVALVRAGREYPALQVAESSALLETLNALMFPELSQWRDLCASEDFPTPPPFDDEQISLVQSLYSKGITQTHPLYRDFRRAMRQRKYEVALSVIRTIVKINSYDAEAARECEKLRKRVAQSLLPKLESALNAGDEEATLELCERLDPDADAIVNNPIWERATSLRKELQQKENERHCERILRKLSEIDAAADWETAVALLSDLNIYSEGRKFTDAQKALVEKCSADSAKMHAEKLAAEKAARARNLISIELEQPSYKSPSANLRRLVSLKADVNGRLDEELAKKLDARMSFLRKTVRAGRVVFAITSVAAIIAVCVVSFFAYKIWTENNRLAEADSYLAGVEQLGIAADKIAAVGKFETENPDLRDNPRYSARLAKLRESANAEIAETKRIEKILASIEAVNFATARSAAFDDAATALSTLSFDISSLESSLRSTLKDRIDKLAKKLKAATEKRKIAIADKTRDLLEKYEKVLSDYDSFQSELPKLVAREAEVVKELRPIMEDISANFKPHQIDLDRFNDITAKIVSARSRYEKFGMLREALYTSRNVDDFMAAVEMLSSDGVVPAEFARKLAPIVSAKQGIKLGQTADFADASAIGEASDAFTGDKAVLPESKVLTSLYKYTSENGNPVYTIAPVDERTQRWEGGYTTVQEAREISFGGNLSSTRYMKSATRGREPTGELLVGGALSPESLVGREVFKTATGKSLLEALSMIANSNVNPAYKAYLERVIIEKLRSKPVATGFAFSPSAKEHASKVMKNTAGMFDYSWVFEKDSKLRFLKSELYSKVLPDFMAEAKKYRKAVEIAEQSPLELVGIVLENGKASFFKEPKGTLWGVTKKGFERISSASLAIDLSPIFEEKITSKEILSQAEKN